MARVILFGATGTAGQGTLRELLTDSGISSILAVGRRPIGKDDPKLREIVLKDPSDLSTVTAELKGLDACLYCLGISAAGLTEAEYTNTTKTMTLKVLDSLRAQSPDIRFVYISGMGADAKSRAMWARVKGETENEILARCPNTAVIFRPGLIEPKDGIPGQKSLAYKMMYATAPLLRGLGLPVVGTDILGRAMALAAKQGSEKRILENKDIVGLAKSG